MRVDASGQAGVGAIAVVFAVLAGHPATAAGPDDLGLKAADGFRVSLYADETLANDIYAMTLDARGRVVVTGRGYVKTLHDDHGRGRADRASLFATTATGGMGLCFVGNDLWFCGDGWLSRYRDGDGDGRADGPPERLLPLAFTEHGGHAVRKGPDGYLYVIGGNDSGIGQRHVTMPGSPVAEPEAGAVLRLTPDGRGSEVLAHGFRNPYDFDFNPSGDLFTYDSDVERDAFLPWYAPTRLFQVAEGGHHGWRLTGFMRSWPRPGYDPGTVDILRPIGRGSPTGVVCYRHRQFPERFRGGLFFLDWTFGKVYFARLTPDGAGYRAEPEVFLEPTGAQGFAPTDVEVAPDGSLFICIGGRGTRGAVYRVQHVEGSKAKAGEEPASDLERVLRAPQPLEAWSRADWEPAAERAGREAFLRAAGDEARPAAERVRAVEVITERFAGFAADEAERLAASREAPVRARVAWSLGRVSREIVGRVTVQEVLNRRVADPDPRVRLAALDAWIDRGASGPEWGDLPTGLLVRSLGDAEKPIRLAAAQIVAGLEPSRRGKLVEALLSAPLQARLSGLLAELLRTSVPTVNPDVADSALRILRETEDPGLRLQAVRLIIGALGDYHWDRPPVETLTAYTLGAPLEGHEALAARVREGVRPLFPTGYEPLDDELARLLGMLEDDDPEIPGRVARFWTDRSPATRDFHYLTVFARLRGRRDASLTPRVARTLVALDRKLDGQEQRIKQSWNDRLGELVGLLVDRDPGLGRALLDEPGLVAPGNVAVASAFGERDRREAARRFLARVRADDEFPWSGPLVELFGALPAEEVRPVYRERWSNLALRDALLPRLADPPDEADRPRYLEALDSALPDVLLAALGALERLPRDAEPGRLVPLLRLFRRLTLEPREAPLRRGALALIERQSGERFGLHEPPKGSDPAAVRAAYKAVFDWFERRHPEAAGSILGTGDPVSLGRRLAAVDWSRGEAARGAKMFETRGCQTCHTGARSIGPDLTGVTGRFSRDDLFTAIAAPSLDVSPLYRTVTVATRDGLVYTGIIAFESADGLILQTGATTTVRLATPEIVERRPSLRSLMPDNLLEGLGPGDLADMDAYLRSLAPRTASGAGGR
jgi:putative membrane-bound dehydrogenase-like protein